ncbi:MAG: hypothetical protein L6R36_007104 [Xanthoria steineri]|nr:MAG: hypothetical protein L6R36_007104 [Xanthoria steineri]
MSTLTARRTSASSLIPLTFGIELEHVLAFHASLLTPLIPVDTWIAKQIPHDKRIRLCQTTYIYQLSRPKYHGWGLTAPTSYPSPFGSKWHTQCILDHGYRGYADEILRMEQAIFNDKNQHVVVHDGEGKMQQFGKWYLTTDTSLVGASPEELASIVGEDKAETGEWDSGPVELVSRVLDVDAADSFSEVAGMFELLNAGQTGKTKYKAFTDQWCGLHVHIGLPPSPQPSLALSNSSLDGNEGSRTFALPLLQHLAYITIIYEPVLSLLHPPNRRPDHPNGQIDLLGNREGFYAEPDYSTIDWDAVPDPDSGYASDESGETILRFPTDPQYRKDKGKGLNAQKMTEWNYGHDGQDNDEESFATSNAQSDSNDLSSDEENDPNSHSNLRRRAHTLIFPPPSHRSHPMTLAKLCHLMNDSDSDRRRLINWTYLLRDPPSSSSLSSSSDSEHDVKYDDKGRPRAKGPQTLEFRQHEATFDARGVEMWVRFCAGLVRWGERGAGDFKAWVEAGDVDDEEEEEWFQDYYGRGELGIEKLIERMGLDGEMGGWVEGRVRLWKEC